MTQSSPWGRAFGWFWLGALPLGCASSADSSGDAYDTTGPSTSSSTTAAMVTSGAGGTGPAAPSSDTASTAVGGSSVGTTVGGTATLDSVTSGTSTDGDATTASSGGAAGTTLTTSGAGTLGTSTSGVPTPATGAGGSGMDVPVAPEVPEGDYCAEAANWDFESAAFEDEVLAIVNENRQAGWDCGSEGQFAPAGPLSSDPALRCAARLHSKDMNDRGFTDHVNPDGASPDERMEAAGYDNFTWGENIAWGQDSPEEVVDWWMNSDVHCANIMGPNFTLLGVGFFSGDGQWGEYWTQNFGSD